MTNKDLNWVFERCLERLQGGDSLAAVLADYPEWTNELKPVLESILAIWEARGSDTIPVAAMLRSREQLTQEAQRRKAVEPRVSLWVKFARSMRAVAVPAVILLIVLGLGGTALASIDALPGEMFYPVKLAAERMTLNLPASSAQRLEREETFDLRRYAEVEKLRDQQRVQTVNFAGHLTIGDDKVWRVNQIPVDVPAEMVDALSALVGQYVYLRADLLADGRLVVEWFESRLYTISGRVTALDSGRFRVDDLWIELSAQAALEGVPALGQQVTVSVIRLSNNRLVAARLQPGIVPSANYPYGPGGEANGDTDGAPEALPRNDQDR